MSTPRSYAEAGVDVAAGERAVELMKDAVSRAQRPETVGGLGGFAGLFDASALKDYTKPLLATATDGVGTKVAVAQALEKHHTIGQDLVAMVVDDLVVSGAEPLFMTDYIACGKVQPEVIAQIVSGIAYGCELAGCALLGGETAEHPGLLAPGEYDVAGAGTAVVEADNLLGPHRVQAGDRLIAMASSGLHSNGYSLARAVLLGADGPGLATELPELGQSVGMELLEPTRIYAQVCLALARAELVSGFAHVTGGGIAANLARVLPEGLAGVVERDTWRPGGVFQ
nr:phosphoribosylformylglycinamidine cyclo-ligase [Actinomycetes bacterium]